MNMFKVVLIEFKYRDLVQYKVEVQFEFEYEYFIIFFIKVFL